MRTDRQKQASRTSGAKSRGPVTPEGKLASSRNAMTHGMLSATVVLEDECEERFLAFLAALHDELQPQTTVEDTLVQNMAVARWRQMRLWATEKATIRHEIRRQGETQGATYDAPTQTALAFRTLSDDSRSLDLIHRYDAHFDRQFLRAHRRLLELVDRRTPPPAEPPHKVVAGPGLTEPGMNPTPPDEMTVKPSESAPQQPENVFTKRTREPLKPMQLPLLATLRKKIESPRANRREAIQQTGSRRIASIENKKTSPVLSVSIPLTVPLYGGFSLTAPFTGASASDPWPDCLFRHPVTAAPRFRSAACAIIFGAALFIQAISARVAPESLSTRRIFCQRSSE
jgi:hypothetical protein